MTWPGQVSAVEERKRLTLPVLLADGHVTAEIIVEALKTMTSKDRSEVVLV